MKTVRRVDGSMVRRFDGARVRRFDGARVRTAFGIAVLAMIAAVVPGAAMQRGDQAPAAATPRATAPLDLTGYWVSVVTEDWRWRMLTPAKGDAPGIPLNAEGMRVTNAWDLARDNATGNQCKAFGAAGIMRIPTRLRISWQDDSTLKIETDAGTQTRMLRFHGPVPPRPTGRPSLQGFSVASWQLRDSGTPLLAPPAARGPGTGPRPKGSLKVVTTNLTAGYTRKNGIPYSDRTVLTEYFDRHDDFGSEWFTVMTVVDDPTYYVSPFVTTTHFKRDDGSRWNPQPCETMPPTVDVIAKGQGN